MSREEMIQQLIFDLLEHASDMNRYRWLQQVLETGFRGFANMTDAELAGQVQARGLDSGESTGNEDNDSFDVEDISVNDILWQGVVRLREIEAGQSD